jgi:AcrR family transcriptional regulator
MGPMERRERERLALRRKILDAARRLFAEEGYDAVTMRTIANEIEYSPRTIYLHFKDKEELIRELCQEDFAILGHGFAKLLKIQDPLERLAAMGRAYSGFARDFPHHYRLMFMTTLPLPPNPEVMAKMVQPEADAYGFLRDCLLEAHTKGLLRPGWEDPDLAAQVIWGALHGLLSLHITHQDDPFVPWRSLEARVDGIIQLIQDGLRPPGEPAPKPRKR